LHALTAKTLIVRFGSKPASKTTPPPTPQQSHLSYLTATTSAVASAGCRNVYRGSSRLPSLLQWTFGEGAVALRCGRDLRRSYSGLSARVRWRWVAVAPAGAPTGGFVGRRGRRPGGLKRESGAPAFAGATWVRLGVADCPGRRGLSWASQLPDK
jgi:hypothetical protein